MKRLLLGVLLLVAAVVAVAVLAGPPVAQAQGAEQPERCERACAQRAERVLKACVDQGGAKERCRAQAAKAKDECLRACPGRAEPGPVPVEPAPRACEERCERFGKQVFDACMELPIHPSERQCKARQAEAIRICMRKTCVPKEQPRKEQPDPAVCKERCENRAREMYDRCVAGSTGVTPEDCGKRAREWLKTCLEKNCKPAATEPQPDPAACRERCTERVKAWYDGCIAPPDANPAECRAQAREHLAKCVEGCRP